MNKLEFVKAVAERTGMTQKATREVLDEMQEVVFSAMAAKDEIKLFDGITLVGKEVPERVARNPQNGEEIVVPQHVSPKAKFGTAIKNYLKA